MSALKKVGGRGRGGGGSKTQDKMDLSVILLKLKKLIMNKDQFTKEKNFKGKFDLDFFLITLRVNLPNIENHLILTMIKT